MRARAVALSCVVWGCGAAPTPTRPSDPPLQAVTVEELGMQLLIPEDWTLTRSPGGWLLAGPNGTDAYYTTVTVQAVRPRARPSLDRWLADTYRRADALYDVRLGPVTPEVIAGLLALRYSVAFDAHEHARRRTGVLIELLPYVVDVSYTAPEELYAVSLGVFEQLLDALQIESVD